MSNATAETISFAEINKTFEIACPEGKYTVCVDDGDPFLLMAYVLYGSPAWNFQHPRVEARKPYVSEFKRYRFGNQKYWTSKPTGIIPLLFRRSDIHMRVEKGYSYVKVVIGGESYFLSVSGGSSHGGHGWSDWVRQGSALPVIRKVKHIRPLLDTAVPLDADTRDKFLNTEKDQDDRSDYYWQELCAEVDVRSRLEVGSRVMLAHGSSYEGSRGPFDVIGKIRRKNQILVRDPYRTGWGVRVRYNQIGWTDTARLNGIELPTTEPFIRRV